MKRIHLLWITSLAFSDRYRNYLCLFDGKGIVKNAHTFLLI